jgi:hypothetical protein
MDRRKHHRAQLRLPVRLRWRTPLGQKTEVRETLDVSRHGLLVRCEGWHDPGTALWVTFPYDHSAGDGQPEAPAKVVRAAHAHNGQNEGGRASTTSSSASATSKEASEIPEAVVGLHFERWANPQTNGSAATREQERRASPRRPLAWPIRVRPENIPWFEEAMSVDVSSEGLRFLSNREYRAGEKLLISFETAGAAPWTGATAFLSRVVRIEQVRHNPVLAVSVCRLF